MTAPDQFAQSLLWSAQPVLQLVLAVIMYLRKMHRSFPMFFTYTVAQIAFFLIVFPLEKIGPYSLYFYTYWATMFISVVLGFRVIHEVFLDVFRPYHTLRDLGTVLFRWAGLVMLMVAAVVAASTAGGAEDPLANGILILQRSMRVVQVGLVLFLLVFSRYLGTNWKQKSFGVALGFGGYAGVELSLVAMNWWQSNVHHQSLSAFVNIVAYDLAILVWTGYMLAPAAERANGDTSLQTRRWEESLTDIQHPATADSLIPMFEGIVDRALSRRPDNVTAMGDLLSTTDGVLKRQAAAAGGSGSRYQGPVLASQDRIKS
jgi:hypothetical protein